MEERLRVFLTYRRNDQQFGATMLRWGLEQVMPGLKVVKDVIDIPYGRNFMAHIRSELKDCDAILVLIGSAWDSQRLHDTEDPVRFEIELAFESGLQVIPVLVEAASVPRVEELPDTVKALAYQNAAILRPDPDFEVDLQRLVERGLEPIASRRQEEAEKAQTEARQKQEAERKAKRDAQRLRRQPKARIEKDVVAPGSVEHAPEPSAILGGATPSQPVPREPSKVSRKEQPSTAIVDNQSLKTAAAMRENALTAWLEATELGRNLLSAMSVAMRQVADLRLRTRLLRIAERIQGIGSADALRKTWPYVAGAVAVAGAIAFSARHFDGVDPVVLREPASSSKMDGVGQAVSPSSEFSASQQALADAASSTRVSAGELGTSGRRNFESCEDFHRLNPHVTLHLDNPNTSFTRNCQSVSFARCLAFDERIASWTDFDPACPGASLYSVSRRDGTCCDSFAFRGDLFSGRSGYYCCR